MSAFEAVAAAIAQLGGDAQFFDHYWDKKHGFVSSAEAGSFDHIQMVEEIGRFLDRTDIRHPSLRIVKDGIELPVAEFTRELRLGNHTSHDWVVNEQVFASFNAGSTIVLQMLQHSVPGFGLSANALERWLESNVQLSAFITPPDAQGFTPHYDTYGFFAIQLFGEKKWHLYDKTPQLPLRDDRDSSTPWTSVAATAELTLTPGDVLFIPRGLYHSANTSAESSVHMTVGIFSPNWIDVLRDAIPALTNDDRVRISLSGASSATIPGIAACIRDGIDLENGIQRSKERIFHRHIDCRSGRLTELLEYRSKRYVAFERQPVPYIVSHGLQKTHLKFCGKELQLPRVLRGLIEFICASKEPFDISSLPVSDMDAESVDLLLEHLVEEGFLRSLSTDS